MILSKILTLLHILVNVKGRFSVISQSSETQIVLVTEKSKDCSKTETCS